MTKPIKMSKWKELGKVAEQNFGSLQNLIYSQNNGLLVPKVGAGVTVIMWTDRYAGTVISVAPDRKSFVIQEDRVKRIDDNGMSEMQEYEYFRSKEGLTHLFKIVSRGKNKGQWRENGRNNGSSIIIGVRRHYHDYSF